jgi:hypothetical protein
MTPEELLEEWTEGETGMRPARVQEVRDDLMEHTGLSVPRRRGRIRVWVLAMVETGSVARRLKEESSAHSRGE